MSFPSGGTVTLNFADMIGSLFKDISQVREPSADGAEEFGGADVVRGDDEALLAAGAVVRKIALRSGFAGFIDAADLVQTVFLRLLKWQRRRPDSAPEPSADEWRAIGAKTAYNEAKRNLAGRRNIHSIDEAGIDARVAASPAADTGAEVVSLVQAVWREIGELSTSQRRALILSSDELVVYLLQCGVTEGDICDALSMSRAEWRDAAARLPLTDAEIAALQADQKTGRVSSAGAVKKARFEARKKLGRLFKR